MIAAGIDPDLALAALPSGAGAGAAPSVEMEVDAATIKRLPSGSPDGKTLSWTDSDSVYEEEDEQDKSLQSKEEWKLMKRGKETKMPTKRDKKRLRRIAREKENKIEARRHAKEEKEKDLQAKEQVRAQAQAQAQAVRPRDIAGLLLKLTTVMMRGPNKHIRPQTSIQ